MGPSNIYDSLKEQIIWLDLKPESILNVSELAGQFGVSRTPVKEALLVLRAEDWVVCNGSRFMVTPLSLKRIKEITEIRSVLEIQSNEWAMDRISPDEMKILRSLCDTVNDLDPNAGNRQIVKLDVAFHRTLYSASRNDQMGKLLDRLLSHYLRFWLSIPRVIDPFMFFEEMRHITKAIETKDHDLMREWSRNHISISVDEIRRAFL